MGPLSEEFSRQWPELSNGMLNFLLRWEAKHPLCGKTMAQVEAGVRAAGLAALREQDAADEDRAPEETSLEAFYRALGQKQPPRPSFVTTCSVAHAFPAPLTEDEQAKCREENLRNALMDKAHEFAEAYELAETRKLAQEALEQKVRNAEAERDETRAKVEQWKGFQAAERDAKLRAQEQQYAAEDEIERLKAQLAEWGKEMIQCGERECAVAGREANLDWLRQRVKDLEVEVERLKPALSESLEASARWLDEKATPSKQADAERKGTEQGYLRAETIEHIRILLAGIRGLQVEVKRLKEMRDAANERAEKAEAEVASYQTAMLALHKAIEGLRLRRNTAEAEVVRLKAREVADLADIEGALDGEDTLGATIRRLTEENERLKAQPLSDEAVMAIARATLRAAAETTDAGLNTGVYATWAERGIDAALAEAAKCRPHGTWVPFEVGDKVRIADTGQPVTINTIALQCSSGVNGRFELFKPLPPEPEASEKQEATQFKVGDRVRIASMPERIWEVGTPEELAVSLHRADKPEGGFHWTPISELSHEPLPPEPEEKCSIAADHDSWAEDGWNFCANCGEKLGVWDDAE